MEDEIQEKLEEIYNFRVDVKFKDFRLYDIYCRIDSKKVFCIPILYDAKSTFEANITNIKQKINRELIELFLKKQNSL